uniref:Putative pilin n=1 Tax=Magnetococcus massalia (strain MO-1) TaxID=451514 RepID=A0A1S7LJK2_MAGMO|nr:putative pilin [Candidatus Magnetococcus massalia]
MVKQHREAGFTLVEVAIVLVILGLLLSQGLLSLSTMSENAERSDTEVLLEEAIDSLEGFAAANGYLPCPADPAQTTGVEDRETDDTLADFNTCKREVGVLPWSTLGLSGVDRWGHRLTYHVDLLFADDPGTTVPEVGTECTVDADVTVVPERAFFALCTAASALTVRAGSVYNRAALTLTDGATIAQNIVAVVVSHGKNSHGSFKTDGNRLFLDGGVDELENGDDLVDATGAEVANPDRIYVQGAFSNVNRRELAGSTEVDDSFDDQIQWISANTLKKLMIDVGRLP